MKIFRRTIQNSAVSALVLTLMMASSTVARAQDQGCLDACASLANSVRQETINSIMAQAYSVCSQYAQYSGAEAGCLASMASAASQAGETAASSAMAGCTSHCSGGGGGGGGGGDGPCGFNSMSLPAFANLTGNFPKAGMDQPDTDFAKT